MIMIHGMIQQQDENNDVAHCHVDLFSSMGSGAKCCWLVTTSTTSTSTTTTTSAPTSAPTSATISATTSARDSTTRMHHNYLLLRLKRIH